MRRSTTPGSHVRTLAPKGGAAAILVAAILLAGAGSASAAGNNDGGYWYYQDYGVADAAAEGYTGAGVTVAVIDLQVNTAVPELSDADITVREPSFCSVDVGSTEPAPAESDDFASASHATEMISYLAGNGKGSGGSDAPLGVAPDAKILYYSTGYEVFEGNNGCPLLSGEGNFASGSTTAIASAINEAVADGADIISISISSGGSNDELYGAVANAIRSGVVVVAARPNSGASTDDTTMWGTNGVVTVQAMDVDGVIQKSSAVADPYIDVVGPGVDVIGRGTSFDDHGLVSGTSSATAITAGFLAVVKSKYPDATGSQLIQSLIRNTGVEDHELERDPDNMYGYGAVSLRHMLANDPTLYDDVNPVLTTDSMDLPTFEDVYGAETTDPTAVPNEDPAAGNSHLVVLLVIAIVGVLVVAGLIILTVVLVRRSNRKSRA